MPANDARRYVMYTFFMPYIIAGLGNPGEEYKGTRHNAGRIAVGTIKHAYDFSDWKPDMKTKAQISKGEIDGEKVTLVVPDTFMNKSGSALAPLATSPKKAEKLIVIYDDLDLPIGTMRMSFNRGSGGHRGLESIIKSLKTEAFVRIRIGIAPTTPSGKTKKPSGESAVEKHILGEFKKPEQDVLKKNTKRLVEILPVLFEKGLSVAMSEFNKG